MTLVPSSTLRDYVILEQIGSGGFGAVYRAHQTSVERDVALKVILPVHSVRPEFAMRFVQEAQTIAALEHPHIVPLYDFWQDAGGPIL
ncbi:MAG: protein kinase [Chloroflexi bacterium]|nr:protein kinase [Chloroflexota bacterium]